MMSKLAVRIACRKCNERYIKNGYKGQTGFMEALPVKVLENSSVVYTQKCTLCDYKKVYVVKPELHQPTKYVYKDLTTGEIYDDRSEIPKGHYFHRERQPVGEPYLRHCHGKYGCHPVKRKHRK